MRHLLLALVLVGCPDTSKPDDDDDEHRWDTGTYTLCCETDGDGWTGAEGDCDDSDPTVNPDAEEICDGMDNNCNGEIDENGQTVYYADADGDGFGDAASSVTACEPADGYVSNADDCDDSNATVYPYADEVCDGLDNGCNEIIDDDVGTLYADTDADGFGDASVPTTGCEPVDGYVTDATDCDDTDATAYPGATEECDAADNDCDDEIDEEGVCG